MSLPEIDEAPFSVDALVADSTSDGFEPLCLFDSFNNSRSGTPSVPPGFGLTHAHPLSAIREDQVPRPTSRILPTSAPFTPRKISSILNPQVGASPPLANVSSSSLSQTLPSTEAGRATSQAKTQVQSLATETGLSKAIASQSSSAVLQAGDFPALESDKGKQPVTTPTPTPKVTIPVKGNTSQKSSNQSSACPSQFSIKTVEKQSSASVSASSKPISKPVASVETQAKPAVAATAFPPLPPPTSGTSGQSSLSRNNPKTLRLVPTPKTEVPHTGSATPSSTTSSFPPGVLPTRQPSIVSASRFDRPSTPTSEGISDNASITSASMSRANSPPPSKVGSAPVRATTKSMQKKQRREAQKEKTELNVVAAKPEADVEIAPIVGRKKKQKKEKPAIIREDSTPVASRPPSPGPVDTVKEESSAQIATADQSTQREEATSNEITEVRDERQGKETAAKGKGKAEEATTAETISTIPEVEETSSEKPIPTPAAIFQELLSEGAVTDFGNLHLLRPPVTREIIEALNDVSQASQKLTITSEDVMVLASGDPVYKIVDGSHRVMITPNGDCVRNLAPWEEKRYLELQAEIAANTGPAAFSSPKQSASNGFTLIGGRAVPNGPPPYFPTPNPSAADPLSKMHRDEALSYINQYVLPSLSTNPQIEKALNAHPFDPGMLQPAESSAWGSWAAEVSPPPLLAADGSEAAAYAFPGEVLSPLGLESVKASYAIAKEGEDSGSRREQQPMGSVTLLGLAEAESAMQLARKETEVLEKKLNGLLKKNRRLLLGSGH